MATPTPTPDRDALYGRNTPGPSPTSTPTPPAPTRTPDSRSTIDKLRALADKLQQDIDSLVPPKKDADGDVDPTQQENYEKRYDALNARLTTTLNSVVAIELKQDGATATPTPNTRQATAVSALATQRAGTPVATPTDDYEAELALIENLKNRLLAGEILPGEDTRIYNAWKEAKQAKPTALAATQQRNAEATHVAQRADTKATEVATQNKEDRTAASAQSTQVADQNARTRAYDESKVGQAAGAAAVQTATAGYEDEVNKVFTREYYDKKQPLDAAGATSRAVPTIDKDAVFAAGAERAVAPLRGTPTPVATSVPPPVATPTPGVSATSVPTPTPFQYPPAAPQPPLDMALGRYSRHQAV